MIRFCLVSLLGIAFAAVGRADDASPAGVGLDPAKIPLEAVEDRTELSFDDQTAYYGILDHVRQVDSAALRAKAEAFLAERHRRSGRLANRPLDEFPVFVDMIHHADAYRGQPVTLQGHAIRLVKYSAAENPYGIETLYEMWLVTEDSQTNPATVIFTEQPPGLPIGEEVLNGITVHGYFLKLYTYPARDKKVHFAPLILARTVEQHTVAGPKLSVPPWVMVLAIGGVCLLGALAMWRIRRNDRRFRRQVHARFTDPKNTELGEMGDQVQNMPTFEFPDDLK